MIERPVTEEELRSDGTLMSDARTLAALAPRQINDEFTLAKREMQAKGVSGAISVGLFAVALVMLGLMVMALVVAAIMGLATVMPAWLAALTVAACFLLLFAIGTFLGLCYVKRAIPLLPREALRGLRHDLGVLRDGENFDPATLDHREQEREDEKKREEKKKEDRKNAAADDPSAREPQPIPLSDEELRQRIQERREHLMRLRDDLGRRADVKSQMQSMLDNPNSLVNRIRRRWFPWTVAAVFIGTFLSLLRKLTRS